MVTGDRRCELQASERESSIGIVIIGRNEGARLIACLESAAAPNRPLVYVDSGSTDESVEAAAQRGARIVALDMTTPFTAARARNAGVAALRQDQARPDYVQFLDGDTVLAPGWLASARAFLEEKRKVAVACGRRREMRPDGSVFNLLCDREWDTPIGETAACGGDALMRLSAFEAVDGFRESLIAGEEPELCLRLREAGWTIHRLDAEMTGHDIDMARGVKGLGQWLRRARRAGHAFAEVSHLHRASPFRIWARETQRAVFWTGLAGLSLICGLFFNPVFLLGLLAFPLQALRIALRDQPPGLTSFAYGALLMAQKPWEAAGAAQYWIGKIFKRSSNLIEYKKTEPQEPA